MPSIGELRHRLTVQNPTRASDGDGGYTDTWAAASPSPVWGKVEPSTPDRIERMVGNTVDAPVSHIVTLRFHSGITAKTRLTLDGRYLAVRGVQNLLDKDQWLVLACEEITT